MARKRKRNKSRIHDGISRSASGMGSSCDNTTSMRPSQLFPSSLNRNTPFGQFGLQQDQYWLNMYKSYWEARKIVDIPPGDMTREGWEWESKKTTPEKLEELKTEEEKLGLPKEIATALIYERLYGGGLVFLGMKKDDSDPTKASDPIDIEKVGKDDLSFVRAIPSFQVNSSDIDNNPLSPNYHKPEWYVIQGVQVHRSRFLIFDGMPLDEPFYGQGGYLSKNNRLGFGESVLLNLYSEIEDAQGVRQSISHLLHKLSVAIFKKKGIKTLRTSNRGNEILEELEDITQMMSNFRGVLLDAEDDMVNYSSNANTGEGLMIAYLQVLAAASDIPATRFLGQAPGGLNATGESDLVNYYDRISSDQNNTLKLPLTYAGQILARSVFGSGVEDLSVKFNSLWQMSDKEQAEIRQMDAVTITTLTGGPIMLEEDGQKEAEERGVVLNKLTPYEPPEVEPIDLGLPVIPGQEGDEVDTGEEDADIRAGTE